MSRYAAQAKLLSVPARLKAPEATEAEIQATIKEGLELFGCTVLVVHATAIPCWHCHRVPRRFAASKGKPDLIVVHPKWAPGTGLLIEVKRPGAPYSNEEQKHLIESGRVVRCECWEEAEKAFRTMHAFYLSGGTTR